MDESNRITCVGRKFDSALVALDPTEPTPGPKALCLHLAQTWPLCMLADLRRLEQTLPEDLGSPDYLLDGLPPETVQHVSPVVLLPSETSQFWPILEEGWGKDALVCLFSVQEKAALLSLLRGAAQQGAGSGVLAYYWPSILRQILTAGTAEVLGTVIAAIDALLIESDTPGGWQLFVPDSSVDKLRESGLVWEPPEGAEE